MIIKTSSNEDSVVLDCFCGSGTTVKYAHLLNRQWIGIDESSLAIQATIEKIKNIKDNLFISKPEYELISLDDEKTAQSVPASGFAAR